MEQYVQRPSSGLMDYVNQSDGADSPCMMQDYYTKMDDVERVAGLCCAISSDWYS